MMAAFLAGKQQHSNSSSGSYWRPNAWKKTLGKEYQNSSGMFRFVTWCHLWSGKRIRVHCLCKALKNDNLKYCIISRHIVISMPISNWMLMLWAFDRFEGWPGRPIVFHQASLHPLASPYLWAENAWRRHQDSPTTGSHLNKKGPKGRKGRSRQSWQ